MINREYRWKSAEKPSGAAQQQESRTYRRQAEAPPPPPPDTKSVYRKILGLGEQYTANELKAAYHDCAAKFHPDRYATAEMSERRRAEEMMKNINEAYHALTGQ